MEFHRVAERFDQRRLYRSAEQFRAAALLLTQIIAASQGSIPGKVMIWFLHRTRRSLSEDASMLPVFVRPGLITDLKAVQQPQFSDQLIGKLTRRAR